MRGLLRLTWLEIKIFLREPLGAIGTLGVPVLVYLFLGRLFSRGRPVPESLPFMAYGIATLGGVMIAINAVLSLVTIVAIYRESGILKRLRATPLRPSTILVAHVLTKLLFTAVTFLLLALAGRRFFPASMHIPLVSFTLALLLSTWAILALGFVIASVVSTARFAQPLATLVLYPMLALSGLFYPIAALPPVWRALSRVMPITYVVSLLEGIMKGEGWQAHLTDVAALVIVFAVCIALSSKLFRWE
ncbi:MAG TPA: ABC transporter permease [Vicinamibacterales bacterium]|jgi:ABC-2 type transport system permease protein